MNISGPCGRERTPTVGRSILGAGSEWRLRDVPQVCGHEIRDPVCETRWAHLRGDSSERLGHSTVGLTLDVYSHLLPGVQELAVDQFDAAIQAAIDGVKR